MNVRNIGELGSSVQYDHWNALRLCCYCSFSSWKSAKTAFYSVFLRKNGRKFEPVGSSELADAEGAVSCLVLDFYFCRL